jgi:hypothetical protein
MNRRQFAKLAGGAALAAPGVAAGLGSATAGVAPGSRAAGRPAQQTQQEAPKSEAKPKYGMTKEQEERVAQAVQRRERQNAALRARVLPYELEAAFVFKVQDRRKPRMNADKRR